MPAMFIGGSKNNGDNPTELFNYLFKLTKNERKAWVLLYKRKKQEKLKFLLPHLKET
ncbi:hypothetical protein J4466_05080 [Candidatus Pacearchaeota archaeon]|nr:hypothetical protein [Candidatus Pacearchaeota archaeon]